MCRKCFIEYSRHMLVGTIWPDVSWYCRIRYEPHHTTPPSPRLVHGIIAPHRQFLYFEEIIQVVVGGLPGSTEVCQCNVDTPHSSLHLSFRWMQCDDSWWGGRWRRTSQHNTITGEKSQKSHGAQHKMIHNLKLNQAKSGRLPGNLLPTLDSLQTSQNWLDFH